MEVLKIQAQRRIEQMWKGGMESRAASTISSFTNRT